MRSDKTNLVDDALFEVQDIKKHIAALERKFNRTKKMKIGMLNVVLLLLLVSTSVSLADEATDKKIARAQIGISHWEWKQSGFGVVMTADITITNNSPWNIKDIEIEVVPHAASGTELGRHDETIYEVVPAHSLRSFQDVHMGFIYAETKTAGALISDFTFCEPHPSLKEIKEDENIANMMAATNALLARVAADEKKKAGAAAALKFNQEEADKGGRLRFVTHG